MNSDAKTVRQVRIPEDLHLRILRAAAREQEETGKRVPVVAWVRDAIEMRLQWTEQGLTGQSGRVPPAGRTEGR